MSEQKTCRHCAHGDVRREFSREDGGLLEVYVICSKRAVEMDRDDSCEKWEEK